MTSIRICKTHGDLMRACQDQHNRSMYCDGQGSLPKYGKYEHSNAGTCPACGKPIALRADGTIRSHNGRGK